jgi:hypothetical protein
MNDLQFRVLSQEEVRILETSPHNPPVYSEAFSEEDFQEEWLSVCRRLTSRLELFGEVWTLDHQTGDFILAYAIGPDRWIYLTFCSTRLWRPEFVPAVADLLRHLPEDYRVACVTELDEDVDPYLDEPVVYLVISANSVGGNAVHASLDATDTIIFTPANDVLARFGFPEAILSNDAIQDA